MAYVGHDLYISWPMQVIAYIRQLIICTGQAYIGHDLHRLQFIQIIACTGYGLYQSWLIQSWLIQVMDYTGHDLYRSCLRLATAYVAPPKLSLQGTNNLTVISLSQALGTERNVSPIYPAVKWVAGIWTRLASWLINQCL